MKKEAIKASIRGLLNHYMRHYGTIRLAWRVDDSPIGTLLVFTKPFRTPGDVPALAATTILDDELCSLMRGVYKTMDKALRDLGLEILS